MKKGLMAFLLVILLGGCIQSNIHQIGVAWQERLYSPTQVTKIGEKYFIVDAWHHRIIYSEDIDKPIGEWEILDNKLGGPHSIATDGESIFIYLLLLCRQKLQKTSIRRVLAY